MVRQASSSRSALTPHERLRFPAPYFAILNKQAQIMIKAGAELGFSPASRSRVQVVAVSGSNPFLRNSVRHDPFNSRPKPWEFDGRHEPDEFFGD